MGDAEKAWLRDFDRTWDTKDLGRTHSDALDRPTRRQADAPDTSHADVGARAALEALLIQASGQLARLTVPRQTKAGWSIHLIMRCGKRVRAHFDDLATATQAFEAIEELSLWFPRG